METITMCSGGAQGAAPVIVFRLDDGGQTFYHSTGIQALPQEAEKDNALRDKLARKTHVDMLNKVQINYYAAGLHREGSKAVFRYTSLELADRFALLNAAFGEERYKVEGL